MHVAEDVDAAPSKEQRVASLLVLAIVLAVSVWAVGESLWTIRVDLASLHARRDLASWRFDPKGATPLAWERAEREAIAALRLSPESPPLHDLLSGLYFVRSRALPREAEIQRRELIEQALRYQEKSLALLPQNADGWAETAALRQMLGQSTKLVIDAWNKALAYGPHEESVRRRLIVLAFATWPEATPQMKRWVGDLYRQSSQAERAEFESLAEAFEVSLNP